jgi:hypothetical protein
VSYEAVSFHFTEPEASTSGPTFRGLPRQHLNLASGASMNLVCNHVVQFLVVYHPDVDVGNKLLTTISNLVTNLNLSDVWTCYKAFKQEVLRSLDLRENRFGFEQEITIKIAQGGWRVYEIPVAYYGRTYAEGKKITWRDGVRAIWCILRYGLLAASSKAPQAKPVVQPMNRGNEGKSAQ